ncbi:MAG: carbamoyltransferase C-terminal domain-containing protein [Planctomycetota bacterium]
MKVLGLHKDPWHNTGAAVVYENADGVEFANLAEERADRKKDSREFPEQSTRALMKQCGVEDVNEFDLIVMDHIRDDSSWRNDHLPGKPCSIDNFLADVDPAKIRIINHHLAHAYNVFYSSGFDSAAVLIVDGRGSQQETQSLYRASIDGGIELLASTDTIGIGLMYAAVTQAIGFKLLQEGKTMGLAPYGRNYPKQFLNFSGEYDGIVTSYADLCEDGSYDLKVDLGTLADFEAKAAVAFEAQEECERAYLHLAQYAKEMTGEDNLCISGGVALNSVANYAVLQAGIFDQLFVNPAASDTGIPLGCALWGYHTELARPRTYSGITPYLGPSYSEDEVRTAVESFDGYDVVSENAFETAAEWLCQNKIIGCFQGRSEMGPRALGNRSILMSPCVAENKDVLNARVKFREAFRPFAPAILDERRSDYFVIDCDSPYMLLVPDVVEERKNEVPATTHVDGTGRLQTVTEEFNPRYYKMIQTFAEVTGTPVLLNTSFNVAGEPIVESPEDAIRCFLGTDIDALLIEDYFLIKRTDGSAPAVEPQR